MRIITYKINEKLREKNITIYQLSKIIGYGESALYRMIKGQISLSPSVLEKIIPILEISKDEFESWIIADKYSIKILELAINLKKEINTQNNKLIITSKIDKLLVQSNISRTILSKQINYSQSNLNQIITGKRSMSKSVLTKLSIAFDISKDEILAWVLADKYDVKTLELAVLAKNA